MLRKALKSKQALVGFIMIWIVVVVAVFAPLIAANDPGEVNPAAKFLPAGETYPMGTDQLGRCVFSRLVYGARYSLGIALPVLLLLALVSITAGTLTAYIGGRFDRVYTIVSDIFMAFPPLLIVLSLVGALGQGVFNIMIAVVLSTWAWFARMVRSFVMIEMGKGYVASSKIIGCSDFHIIIRHIIPNILPSLIVYFSTAIASIILAISGFSFLGLGIEAGLPEWGAMLSNARDYLYSEPMLIVYPGLCILFAAAGFNLFGEALRDIISPEEA